MNRPSVKLSLQAVDKFYGAHVHAVKALSMDVHEGEIVALLGSSGCGKTSTLRMVAGFEAASAGTMNLAGREINRLPPVKRNVAMAFEGYSLYPPLTVRENMAFALKSAKLSRTDTDHRVNEVAELLDITDIMDRYPVSISGGQQQRASLGRALVRDADLHLLDEPMGQLEPQLRAVLRGRLKHFIKERRLTAILVTHDQTEANALADRIAVMEDGVLQQFDSPAQLKDEPANLFTGTFIGEPPMNVFASQVTVNDHKVEFGLTDSIKLEYETGEFPAEVVKRLANKARVVLGVRPYAVRRRTGDTAAGPPAAGPPAAGPPAAGTPAATITARVMANQWLGDQTHIATQLADQPLVLVEHDRLRMVPGDTVQLDIGAHHLHLFDEDSGVAVFHGSGIAT